MTPRSLRRLLSGARPAPRTDLAGPLATGPCEDLAQTPAQVPARTTQGCEECLALGARWLHLRQCLTCGHVGCCDSDPYRHATQHFRATGHPVMRSFQPGEAWRWCYVHEQLG